MDRREISKVVKVSDPEMWYGQQTVVVKLFVCPEWKGQTEVRMYIESIDDFAMEYSRVCYYDSQIECAYNYMKKYMFDKMPKTISYNWLREHGYFNY